MDLERFIEAQNRVYRSVLEELRAGEKQSHWMWFIFPQLRGLGHSAMAQRFGIASLAEARSYMEHPVLGPRLRECTELVNAIQGRDIEQIFGYPDEMKFRSSMTLFAQATDDNRVFLEAIAKYFGGAPDARTLELLKPDALE